MHITQPITLTELYIENDSSRNKYTGLLNANFQDYMDSLAQGGRLQVKAKKLIQRISSLGAGIGMAAGVFGGPGGIALGTTIGNTVGKYFGNVLSDRLYGQAIADVSEIFHDSKLRHAQIASSLSFTNQMDGAIDTLRQNENKRRKDDIQSMQV
jgi:hypothetical protein